ncbi:glycoside hydrolase superfamily [Aspergillus granulosus]|uniref:beta-glucosidase n=1 Tax=Aspergillus granulosus TaxID=176169 RepID=A0ABR4H804_9EURO
MTQNITFQTAVESVKCGQEPSLAARALLHKLTENERLSLLHGDPEFWEGMYKLYNGFYLSNPYVHGEIKRLGIPGIRYCDGPRGVNINIATAFPVSMARGATWDPSLEERVAQVIGLEARVYKANTVGSASINLPRHPAWGRVQETYGEDPMLLGEFGAAHVRGLRPNVMPCVKHLALNSMETARFRVNVTVDEAALYEVYLPHFQQCVEEGALVIMSAYNSVNGEWASENKHLLTDILRNSWGFRGIVISDWVFGVRDGVKSIKAGLDIEAPFQNRRAASVRGALESGELSWTEINQVAHRILTTQLLHYATRNAEEPTIDMIFNEGSRQLAREVASKSMVLLKNTPVNGERLLPLPDNLDSIAVIGRLANSRQTGDRASSLVACPEVISAYDGIRDALPHVKVLLSGSDNEEHAVSAAAKADIAVLVVGYDAEDEGEFLRPSRESDPGAQALLPEPDNSYWARRVQAARKAVGSNSVASPGEPEGLQSRPTGGDRRSVRLRDEDVQLIHAVATVNPRVIVSVITAGAIIAEEWRFKVPAFLVSWYSGCQGGRALADILTGAVNPSGHLPWSMPRSEADLPEFDPNMDEVTYTKWIGQRLLDHRGVTAAYPLGFGLSYTKFVVEKAAIGGAHTKGIRLQVQVRNIGERPGRCVVQVYGCPTFLTAADDFPTRVLAGFQSVELHAHQSKSIEVVATFTPFQRWLDGHFVWDVAQVVLEVGQFAGDPEAAKVLYHASRSRI